MSSGFAWEQRQTASWAALADEDDDSLENAEKLAEQQRRALREQREVEKPSIYRGMIRYVVVVLDLSESMKEVDFKPSRVEVVLSILRDFFKDFLDQNPLCNIALVASRDALAEQLTELSGVSSTHIDAARVGLIPSGEFSLQNSLDLALQQLKVLPSYGSKEIIVVHSALTTTDPSDIYQTIENLSKDRIRCSVVSLASEVHVFKQCAVKTNGLYGVSLNKSHLKELLTAHIVPPPILMDGEKEGDIKAHFVCMGFPARRVDDYKSLCACHLEFKHEGYFCPSCHTKVCELPTQCKICGLNLVSSSHLARSYHHLFPIQPYKELRKKEMKISIKIKEKQNEKKKSEARAAGLPRKRNVECFACLKSLSGSNDAVLVCPECEHTFCWECDAFIHSNLHNCPGCMS